MSENELTVVGGGQMGRALVGGMLAQEVLQAEQILLVDPDPDSQAWWSEHHRGVSLHDDLAEAVSKSPTVMIAVKPNIVPLIAKKRGRMWNGKLVVSIAAGISLDQLGGWIGHQRAIRVMPNTPCLVGEGASAYCGAADVTDQDRAWIETMLCSVGVAVQVDEKQMDAVTGLSGSGPAYVCMMIEAMADGGVLAGLPRPMAMKLAAQTVLGTARMVAETGRHPGELKDAVASPGGTTIAAIAVLEQNGVRGALIAAVEASANRSRDMAGDR